MSVSPATAAANPHLGQMAAWAVVVLLATLVCPAAARATQSTITYQGGGSAMTASGTSISVPAPSTKAVGDMLIMQIEGSGSATMTVGSGFVTIPGATGVTAAGNYVITAYKLSTGAGATSIAVTWSGNREAVGDLLDDSGVDNANPFENTLSSGTDPATGTGASFAVPSRTTTDPNSLVVGLALAWPGDASLTTTAPSSTTSRPDASVSETSAAPYSSLTAFDVTVPATGPTPALTGTFSESTPWEVTAIALRPAQVNFSTAPAVGSLGSFALTGAQQVTHAQMGSFGVTDTRGTTGAKWTVTVSGASGAGLSPVFAQYCPTATCGSDPGPGYVAGGVTLGPGALTLSTSGASWTGSAPTFGCTATPCALGGTTQSTVATDTNGLGTWAAALSASSLTLTLPATTRAFANPGEGYRVDLL